MRPLRFLLPVLAAAVLTGNAPAMETLRQYLPAAGPSPTPAAAAPAEPVVAPDAAPEPAATPLKAPEANGQLPVVRVNVASQSFNFSQPWRKNTPTLRQGLGVVLMDGRILVTAQLVTDPTYVELRSPRPH